MVENVLVHNASSLISGKPEGSSGSRALQAPDPGTVAAGWVSFYLQG